MTLSLEQCRRALDDIVGLNRAQRIENNIKWLSYWDYMAPSHAKGKEFLSSFPKSVVRNLRDAGAVDRNSQVIDIGCGSGAYTLNFAQECKDVTAVDMSEKMLSALHAGCLNRNLRNVTVKNAMFEQMDIDGKYDLVFSAMCPAICDYESLVKFEDLSKKWCSIVTVAQGSSSRLRRELRSLLSSERLKGLSPDASYQFNMLYAMGRLPNLRFHSFTSHAEMTVEQAYERYKIYYGIFGLNEPHHHEIIFDYLQNVAVDGICHDEVNYNMAVMWWKV